MNTPWTATCILVAIDKSRKFWDGPEDRISIRLLLRANDAQDFAAKVRKSVESAGVTLEAVHNAQSVQDRYSNRQPSPAMQDAIAKVDGVTPLMVSAPIPAGEVSDMRFSELSWDDVPAARNLWALIDGVTWPGLPQMLETSGQEWACLYTTTDAQSRAAAPWIVRLDRQSGMLDAIKKQPADQHTGILFRSGFTLEGLRRHFRRYTMLPTPIGGEIPQYFRFYDPRVMLDAMTALSTDVRDQLLAPLQSLIVPLSPHCLLPAEADVTNPPDIFTDPAACQDRLSLVTWPKRSAPRTRVVIDDASFAKFGVLMMQRSTDDLAKTLFDDHDGAFSQDACRQAAKAAPPAAQKFGLSSKKQVTAMARAILIYGPAFWENQSDAAAILNNNDRLAWQRKDDLISWMEASPVTTRQEASR